jgi:hypothetical protein
MNSGGTQFLMIKPSGGSADESTTEKPVVAAQPKITVVVNWFEELNQRALVK